jgi:hypothetical protein
MDCAGNSAGYSSVATQISCGHAALGDIGTCDLRLLYGRPHAAAYPSLFRRTDCLIASRECLSRGRARIRPGLGACQGIGE